VSEMTNARQNGRSRPLIARRWPLVSGIVAVALAAMLGYLITARAGGRPLWLDTAWMNEIIEHRSPGWEVPALIMNYLGGGIIGTFVVPILVIVVLVLLKRPWGALFFLTATLLSAGLVQLLKNLFGRARPADILVTSDYGSFPSGHVANAATMVVALMIIFPVVWLRIVGPIYVLVMLLSRTYLGAHWLSDTAGGLLIGVGIVVIVWAPLATKIRAEHTKLSTRNQPAASVGV
jgi:membrane-associated phospholipid phosphatase